MSIWDYLRGDVGWYEFDQLNEGFKMMLDADVSQSQHYSQQFRKLFALDKAQSRELAALRTMVRVLSDAVVELGFDRERLAERLEAEVKALESEERMTQGSFGPGGPYRGSTAKVESTQTATCVRCQKQALLRKTNVTEHGAVCDSCFYK